MICIEAKLVASDGDLATGDNGYAIYRKVDGAYVVVCHGQTADGYTAIRLDNKLKDSSFLAEWLPKKIQVEVGVDHHLVIYIACCYNAGVSEYSKLRHREFPKGVCIRRALPSMVGPGSLGVFDWGITIRELKGE